MGFLSTHWSGTYEGHVIELVRKTGGHHFELVIDGEVADSESSWVNMGRRHLEGKLRHDGKDLAVEALGGQGAFTESAAVSVGGTSIAMTKVE